MARWKNIPGKTGAVKVNKIYAINFCYWKTFSPQMNGPGPRAEAREILSNHECGMFSGYRVASLTHGSSRFHSSCARDSFIHDSDGSACCSVSPWVLVFLLLRSVTVAAAGTDSVELVRLQRRSAFQPGPQCSRGRSEIKHNPRAYRL